MNIRILNRSGKHPDDGFYQIEALGEHVNHAARVVQVIDAKAVESIVNRFNAEAQKAGEDFPGMRIDKDHLSQSMENSTESLGWTMQLRNRGGLPEARIQWTALGTPLIESKDNQAPVYKFFSTEYLPEECEKIGTRIVNRKTYDVLRPLRLDALSLTNDPNNKGQRPISNRKGNSAGAAETEQPVMKNLLKKLGLAEDASEESAVAAVTTIQNRATSAETERDSLKTERDTLLNAQIEADLEKYAPVIKNREAVKKQLLVARNGTLELLEALNIGAGDAKTDGEDRKAITNRSAAKTPGGAGETPEQKAARQQNERAAKITNRARELRSADRTLSITRSYDLAEAEVSATEGK